MLTFHVAKVGGIIPVTDTTTYDTYTHTTSTTRKDGVVSRTHGKLKRTNGKETCVFQKGTGTNEGSWVLEVEEEVIQGVVK